MNEITWKDKSWIYYMIFLNLQSKWRSYNYDLKFLNIKGSDQDA